MMGSIFQVYPSPFLADVRKEADQAVKEMGWTAPHFVDAYHINMGNVESFLDVSDYFTIDVADYISKSASCSEIDDFVEKNKIKGNC